MVWLSGIRSVLSAAAALELYGCVAVARRQHRQFSALWPMWLARCSIVLPDGCVDVYWTERNLDTLAPNRLSSNSDASKTRGYRLNSDAALFRKAAKPPFESTLPSFDSETLGF